MVYVLIQFTCLVFLTINADLSQLGLWHYVPLVLASTIGVMAIINMRLDNVNILPNLKNNHQLTIKGIYHYIRHPMYTALLVVMLVFITTKPSAINLLVYIILFADLALKSTLEEQYLSKRFTDYQDYAQKTGKFLPKLNKGL